MKSDFIFESHIVSLHGPTPSPFHPDPWQLCEHAYDPANNYQIETLFALGNGTIGLRGTHEETYRGPAAASHEGNYVNGFYESEPIVYPEAAHGFAEYNQFMLNLPNIKRIDLQIGDESFNLLSGKILHYERKLDFLTGILTRNVHWESTGGQQVIVSSERLVSFTRRELFAIRYRLTSVNFTGQVSLCSAIDMNIDSLVANNDPRVGAQSSSQSLQLLCTEQTSDYCAVTQRTRHSDFTIVSGMANVSDQWTQADPVDTDIKHAGVSQKFTVMIAPSEVVELTKFGAYVSSRAIPVQQTGAQLRQVLAEAKSSGFEQLATEQKCYLTAFWQGADVEISGDPFLQQGMRFNQFHLLQSVGRDGHTNIAAKGLTGEGYEGHYFWDTEIYVLPFFLFSKPEIARQLLMYRFNGLDKARARARQMSHKTGALYPWRTIDGEECSAYFPAGTAQYHINADIAYAVQQYLEVTDDMDFMVQYGAEMILETARIWIDLGHYSRDHRFCIDEVTGPDEYTALINNNYYTNLMAQRHLNFALTMIARLRSEFPGVYERIASQIVLKEEETAAWQQAAQSMYLPFDEQLGIHAQDDSFLAKKIWDFDTTPKENYPLLLHYHPLVIYRHQVCKQADLLLAMLLSTDSFSLSEKKKNFDYYEKITTHDSSLSCCIFSIIASEIEDHEKAYTYFMQSARMDLDDTHHNTCHGVHTAAMAGSWMCVTFGFAGMRVVDGRARFRPTLPAQWDHYQFRVQLHGCLIELRVDASQTTYRLLEGTTLNLRHWERDIVLSVQEPTIVQQHRGIYG